MSLQSIPAQITQGALDSQLTNIYGNTTQRERWIALVTKDAQRLPKGEMLLFRSPGRTEIAGNHTDHNNGKVIVGAIHADIIAVVVPHAHPSIVVHNCNENSTAEVSLENLAPLPHQEGSSAALIQGVAAALHQQGVPIRGFCAVTQSTLPLGKGLSSSAAYEALIATILQRLGGVNLSIIETAKACQYAENVYFGKPCGLEDQIAVLHGGVTTIDFENLANIVLDHVNFSPHKYHSQMAVVDTQESHANLTPHYTAIPQEMHAIAQHFGHKVLRQLSIPEIIANIPVLRAQYGDRAILRALHYFRENERVTRQVAALRTQNFSDFIKLVRDSGYSSWMWLQNCVVADQERHQGMALALSVTEDFIKQHGIENVSACRVHGGGFAGAIQLYIPAHTFTKYQEYIENIIAPHVCMTIDLSPVGTTEIALPSSTTAPTDHTT